VVQLQLDPDAATVAPESSTRTEPSGAEPALAAVASEPSVPGEPVPMELAPAAAASEPSAPGEPVPTELAPEADATLPDLPPPELRQDEAEAGGGEQVKAPDAAPTEGTGKRLSAHGWLPRSGRNILTTLCTCRCPATTARRYRRVLEESP
jgi:hypothetical protein